MNEKTVSKSSQGSPKMQQIERYGVIALVFLLVTIVAVSFWGDSKSPGFWSRLTGKNEAKKEAVEVASTTNPLVIDHVTDPNAPLSPVVTTPAPVPGAPIVNGNTTNATDMPLAGTGTIGTDPLNPFAPTTGTSTLPPISTPAISQPTSTPAAGTTAYTIQRGDSLALIAKRQLGAESRWTEIQSANPGLDPKRLKLGATIQLPSGAAPQAPAQNTLAKAATKVTPKSTPAPAPAPKTAVAKSGTRSYTVKKGDMLRSIARAQLGDEGRWKEIQALNPGLDPSKLVVGMPIKLPASGEKHAAPGASKPTSTGTVLASADNKPRVK